MFQLKRKLLLSSLLLSASMLFATTPVQKQIIVVPTPMKMEVLKGNYLLNKQLTISVSDDSIIPAGEYLKTILSGISSCKVMKGTKGDIRFGLSKNLNKAGSYSINVGKTGVSVEAADYSGLIYAIATIRQLLPPEIERTFQQNRAKSFIIPYINIVDAPRFSWRGLMLDSSRHFWTVSEVKHVLDLMAFYKLDRFHWHLTDDQGWRIEIKKYPLLTEKGTWRKLNSQDTECLRLAKEHMNTDYLLPSDRLKHNNGEYVYGGFYTQQDIKNVVAYAAQRGIEIIPEIDMPGHFLAAISLYPDVACSGLVGWGNTFSSPICPGKDSSLDFCKNVYREVFKLFPSKYVHLGGDEVEKTNWKKCADCQHRIQTEGLKSTEELQAWFVRQMENFFKANGKKLIGWDEVGEDGLSSDATIMWWRSWNPDAVPHAVASGKQAVCSPNSFAYFDYQEDKNSIGKILEADPADMKVNEQQKQLILGVQANLWTEWVPSVKRLEYMLFPRLIALSEVAWAEPANKLTAEDFFQKSQSLFHRMDVMRINYRVPDLTGFYRTNAFIGSTSVKLQSPIAGTVIRYTIDGSIPTNVSPRYTTPISIHQTTNFRFRTYRPDGTPSDVVDVTYVKDNYAEACKQANISKEGLTAVWYDYAGDSCSCVDKAKQNGVYQVPNVSIPQAVKGNIGLVITGYMNIPEDGIYTFALNSDDGSTLTIDGVRVIDNDMPHAPREIIGQKALRKGLHPIEVRYFDHNGGILKLSMIDKNGKKTEMDSSWFRL